MTEKGRIVTDGSFVEVLKGLKVLDIGAGIAPAIVTQFLKRCGAEITRLEPIGGDPFYDRYPAYAVWHSGKTIETYSDNTEVAAYLAEADICVVGGEDHPDLGPRWSGREIRERYPKLIVADIAAAPGYLGGNSRPAADLLACARSGFSFEQHSGRPAVAGFAPASFGAALHTITGLLAAIYGVRAGNPAQLISASLVEGAWAWCLPFWYRSEKSDKAMDFVIPLDLRPTIFRCADGKYIHVALGSVGSKARLYRVLGIDDPNVGPDDSGFPTADSDARNFWGDVDTMAEHAAKFDSQTLLEALAASDVPVEPVKMPGDAWEHPQTIINGIIGTDPSGSRSVGFPLNLRSAAGSEAPVAATDTDRHLEGIRVLDFGTVVAGPGSTTPLADWGADVIKVEALKGDNSRKIPRGFLANNRGKRSIAIDLKTLEGKEICRKLCMTAHVVEYNFRPGVAARLGIDPLTLQTAKPDLTVLETTAYGAGGPFGSRPGYDQIFQALGGLEYAAGGKYRVPEPSRSNPVDWTCAMLGSAGMMLGLLWRQKTGRGLAVEASLMNAALFLKSEVVQRFDGAFLRGQLADKAGLGYHPAEAFYETSDGWIAIYAPTDEMAQSLLRALGLDDRPSRSGWGEAEQGAIAAALRERTAEQAYDLFDSHDVWAEIPRKGDRILDNENAVAAGTVVEWTSSKYGKIRQIGRLIRASDRGTASGRGGPDLGADTGSILAELGYGTDQIRSFYERKVVA